MTGDSFRLRLVLSFFLDVDTLWVGRKAVSLAFFSHTLQGSLPAWVLCVLL